MKLKIYYSNEQNVHSAGFRVKRLVKRAVKGALKYEGFPYDAEVSVTFTDNEGIRELNREYRNKDSATDVLSFPMYNFLEGDIPADGDTAELGDIVLSLERAITQADELGHSTKREIAFLTVHSVLHLLGYDHETGEEDEKKMFAKQNEIMDVLGIKRK